MKYIVFIWTTKSGEFVDKLEFDSKDEAEVAVRSMQAHDDADGFPNIYRYEIKVDRETDWKQEAIRLRQINNKLLEACKALVEQFHAYENGWLGNGIWRTRIGLPYDLKYAEAAIGEAEEKPKHIYKPECMCIRCQGWRRVCSEIGIPAVHCLQYERFGIED